MKTIRVKDLDDMLHLPTLVLLGSPFFGYQQATTGMES